MMKHLQHVERVPQLIRFLLVGAFCALVQVTLLFVLVRAGIQHHLANAIAIALSTQVNFVLSSVITWRDRLPFQFSFAVGLSRWGSYNGMAVTTLLVNEGVFALTDRYTHYLIAGAVGILAAAALNYTVSRHLVFVRRGDPSIRPMLLACTASVLDSPSD